MEWIKCWKLKQRRKAHWGPATSPAACRPARPAVITLARSPECSHSWIYLLISFSVSCLSVWTDRRIQNNRNVLLVCFCFRGGCWVYFNHFTEADQSEKRRKRHHSEHSCTQTFISLSFVRSMFHIKVFENLVRIKKRKRKKKQNKTTTEKGGKSGRS